MLKIHTKLIATIVAALLMGSAIGEEKHTHSFSKDIEIFHDVLAPLWHAQAGQERSQNICEQASKLDQVAREIHSGDAGELLKSIDTLMAQCRSNQSNIDGTFAHVHDAFHHLVEHKSHARPQ